MPDNQALGGAMLRSGGVIVDGIFSQPLESIKVTETPTLLLLDSSGRVDNVWVGQLSPQGEKDVISAAEK